MKTCENTGGLRTLPPTVLGAAAKAIRETSSCTSASASTPDSSASATAAAQTDAGVLNSDPEITGNAFSPRLGSFFRGKPDFRGNR